jgi:hypothetical protein
MLKEATTWRSRTGSASRFTLTIQPGRNGGTWASNVTRMPTSEAKARRIVRRTGPSVPFEFRCDLSAALFGAMPVLNRG